MGLNPRWGQNKDYEIGVFCFTAKYAALGGQSLAGSESRYYI